jgi:hypothetical protein
MRLLGIQISPWIWGASWPIGKLECYDDCIVVKAYPNQVSVALRDIDVVVFKKMTLRRILLGDKLEISHHAGAPNRIDFSWYGLSSVVRVLEEKGVRVVTR